MRAREAEKTQKIHKTDGLDSDFLYDLVAIIIITSPAESIDDHTSLSCAVPGVSCQTRGFYFTMLLGQSSAALDLDIS